MSSETASKPFAQSPLNRRALTLPVLLALLALTGIAGLGYGAMSIPPERVIAVLAHSVGLSHNGGFSEQEAAVILHIRLPRLILGMLVGAALAVAGAAMQGLFRNPLADPGLIGVSAGAALGAVAVIVLGVPPTLGSHTSTLLIPLAAFVGGAIATVVVYRLASLGGRTLVATMLLAGIAVNAIAGAGTGVLVYLADDAELRSVTFWNMGSLGGATGSSVLLIAPLILAPVLLLTRYARVLNAFLLGESEAGHLGVDIERSKRRIVALTALAVGAAVALTGIIGFVGLVVPHLLRMMIGPDHRLLLPASALLGACLLPAADIAARTLVAPAELPIGIVTALAGGPFFLWLLLRNRQHGGSF
ncbi:heme ABC transporter permease [Alkalilimnicola ehrlichii]|uniref:Heme ABC transporter permease n=1 Tax=Alkalilimnicola ehrlichii TaxID=351052 RepID=A0A3E0WTR4_9GAMM|nr:iron chelate uptake ABC transporter family permease subunit [Alkalilimnicola ehrlichii]RFA27194.1 heme ABC transporter permease [Alkalilimnicola ehrlichii]RFA35366.1 heme ABC transporter permease [Alkalilimnicola ehrlichii]